MTPIRTISILIAAACICNAQMLSIKQANRSSKNHNAQYKADAPLILAENGTWKAVIVVPSDATPTARTAANEMKAVLERIIAAPIAISDTLVDGKVNILLGENSISSPLAPGIAALPRDGFIIRHIRTSADIIIIAGHDDAASDPGSVMRQNTFWNWFREKGTLFGAYDFLERFCGVGFFYPDETGTPVPRCSGITVPSMDIQEAPDLEERMWTYGFPSFVTQDKKMAFHGTDTIAWLNRERLMYRHDTLRIPYGHGIRMFNLNKRFAATRPEYFSLLPNGRRDLETGECRGHLCLMNPELEDTIVLDAISFLKGEAPTVRDMQYQNPAVWPISLTPGYIPVMLEDGFGPDNFCRCPNCTPFNRANGNHSDYVFGFYSRIAKRIKESGLPGTVTTMAYSTYKSLPSFDLPDNMLLQVATPGPWAETGRAFQKAEEENIRDWNKKLGGERAVSLWTYMNDFGNKVPAGIPAVSPRLVVSYFKRVGPMVRGAFVESEISYRFYHYLNWYAFGKAAWDNSIDAETLLADHHAKMFGPAAAPMAKAYDLIEKLWTSCLQGYENTVVGPVLKTPYESDMWETIFSSERMNELDALVKEAESLARNDAGALARVRYIGEHLIGAVARYRNAFLATRRESEDLVVHSLSTPDDIRIDGSLDEAAWLAKPVYLVPLKRTDDPNALTAVRTAWSDKHLSIAFVCDEGSFDDVSVIKRTNDDGSIWQDNSVELFIGPAGERRYFHIAVNSAGSISDWAVDGIKKDIALNSGARIGITHDGERWTAEIAIPFDAIGGKPESGCIVNFCRSRIMLKSKKLDQLSTWSPFLKGGFHEPEKFGKMLFVKDASTLPDDGNLLANGSFENGDGTEGWKFAEGCSVDTATFRDGRRCARFTLQEFKDAQTRSSHPLPDLKPNTEYVITYFIRTKDVELKPGARYAGGFVNIWSGLNHWFPINAYEPTKSYQGSRPWTKESYVFKTGEKITPCDVKFGFHPAKGTMWIDDIRVREKR